MSVTKVVRVEDVDRHQAPGREKVQFLDGFDENYNADGDRAEDRFSLVKLDQNEEAEGAPYDGEDMEEEDEDCESDLYEDEEARDKVFPLPENWPKIPELHNSRICELTKSTFPAVNKAVSHLELIQDIVEEWFREKVEEEMKSRSGSSQQLSSTARKQLRFAPSTEQEHGIASAKSRSFSASSHMTASSDDGTSLSIKGVGAKTDKDERGLELPFLGAEDVIDEVITLLAWLENDRQETQTARAREKERAITLSAKIDELRRYRMIELPKAVQKEHETCIMDLNELQWHVAYSTRNEARITNRTNIAEVLNKRLKEDISFVQKHIPLVQEKLELELEAMNKIRNAQAETNIELDTTKQRQAKTESKSNEAQSKANNERGHIKHELDLVRDALKKISDELEDAEMTFNAYTQQIDDINNQLRENEQELQVLEVKNDNAKAADEMQAAKVQDLQSKITEAEFEQERSQQENERLEQELNLRRNKNAARIKELENTIRNRDGKLRQIVLKNQEAEMEVQDFYDKIEDCKRQKIADEKNIARIHKEKVKTQQQMNVTLEEFHKVLAINTAIKEQLAVEEEKAFKMEESLKTTAETLRRQVKDEVHTRTVLQARISSDSNDHVKLQRDTKIKKEKAQKLADEVESTVNGVLTKVERLRSAKQEKSKLKEDIKKQLIETKKQKEESQKRFTERIDKIEPHHKHLKDDCLKYDKKLDHIEWKTEMMTKKIDEMDQSSVMMERVVSATSRTLKKLEEEMGELTIQLEAGQKIEEDLRHAYNEVTDRVRDNEARHTRFLEDRQQVLRRTEEEKELRLNANRELASRYRQLQNDFMTFKDKLLNNFEERVKLENAIKDCRQLQSLQKKMRGALLEYYKYRGLYNESELKRMDQESHFNGMRVSELQDELDNALKKITDFLNTQMDGSMAKKMAWEAVQKEESKPGGLATSVEPLPSIRRSQHKSAMVA